MHATNYMTLFPHHDHDFVLNTLIVITCQYFLSCCKSMNVHSFGVQCYQFGKFSQHRFVISENKSACMTLCKSLTLRTFGRYDHEDWCTHRAAVGTWNLDRRSVKTDKPDTVIDSACCVMCLEFHPENPAWLAGGNFNGKFVCHAVCSFFYL